MNPLANMFVHILIFFMIPKCCCMVCMMLTAAQFGIKHLHFLPMETFWNTSLCSVIMHGISCISMYFWVACNQPNLNLPLDTKEKPCISGLFTVKISIKKCCWLKFITLHDNKTCYPRRDRCETIWVCQKILALHQLASTAAQNLNSIHVASKLNYWTEVGNFKWEFWEFTSCSTFLRMRLSLGCLVDVHTFIYICTSSDCKDPSLTLWFACSIWCGVSLNEKTSSCSADTDMCWQYRVQ